MELLGFSVNQTVIDYLFRLAVVFNVWSRLRWICWQASLTFGP